MKTPRDNLSCFIVVDSPYKYALLLLIVVSALPLALLLLPVKIASSAFPMRSHPQHMWCISFNIISLVWQIASWYFYIGTWSCCLWWWELTTFLKKIIITFSAKSSLQASKQISIEHELRWFAELYLFLGGKEICEPE